MTQESISPISGSGTKSAINPYQFTRPVDLSNFFGREDELRQTFDVLQKGQSVWILGEYGSGKTSLLRLIQSQAPSRFGSDVKVHRIDLALESDEKKFFDSLAQFLGLSQRFKPEDIEVVLRDQRLLLLVDEFDLAYSNEPLFSPVFFGRLRAFIQSTKLQMVIASAQTYAETNLPGSPFSNVFVRIQLNRLNNNDAHALLVETALKAGFALDESNINRAIELAQGQPRLLQIIGSTLVDNNQDWDKALLQYREMVEREAAPRSVPSAVESASAVLAKDFTQNSRVALSRANLLRESTREPFIYTGHLLAALYLLEGESPAFTFLSLFGVDRNRLLSDILIPKPDDNRLGEILALELQPDPSEVQALPFSQSVRNVLEKAQQLAQLQKTREISPSHLFASLMENTETAVSHWLENTLGTERYRWIQQKMAESDLATMSFTNARIQAMAIAAGFYQPPTGMDDEATVEDLLNFKRYTDALASIILKPETHPPLVVGVYGPWGSGKSTFLQLIKESLQPSKKIEKARGWKRIRQVIQSRLDRLRKAFLRPQGPDLVIIEYNAWEYTDAPKLWAGLVAKIAKKIDEKLGWRGRLAYLFKRRFRKFIGAVILGFIPVGLLLLSIFSERIGEWAQNNTVITGWLTALSSVGWAWYTYLLQKEPVSTFVRTLMTKFDVAPASGVVHNIQEEIESAIKLKLVPEGSDQQPEISRADVASRVRANEYKIVVLIDELDRCPLERIVDILEAIKLFLAERIFIVLIAIDTRVAAEAIRLHYKEVENPDLPREYLEKIVQLPLQVPAADNQAIKKYLEEHMPGFKASSSSSILTPPSDSDQVVSPSPEPSAIANQQDREPPIPISVRRGPASKLELPDTEVEFSHIAVLAERFLESNPRRIKRLLNTYRYIKVLASTRNEPVYQDDWQKQMLAWLAFTMRWPAFMSRAIEVADERLQGAMSQNVNKKRRPAATKIEPFLVEVTRPGRMNYERPLYDDIRNFLPIDHAQVSTFAKQASNFLIETPTPYPATESRQKKSAAKKKTPKDVKQQVASIPK